MPGLSAPRGPNLRSSFMCPFKRPRKLSWLAGGNVRALRQSASERDVFTWDFVDVDQEVVRRDADGRYDFLVEGLQECEASFLRTRNDERNFEQDEIVRIGQPEKAGRVNEALLGKDVKDPVVILRRHVENLLKG